MEPVQVMQSRFYSVIIIVIVVFANLGLLVEELTLDQQEEAGSFAGGRHGDSSFGPKRVMTFDVFKGTFQLRKNGSETFGGQARVAMQSKASSAISLDAASVYVILGKDGDQSFPPDYASQGVDANRRFDVHLQGLALQAVNTMTAFGVSEPDNTEIFGLRPCRLDALFLLRGPLDSAPMQALAHVDDNEEEDPVFPSFNLRSEHHQARSIAYQGPRSNFERLSGFKGEIVSINCDLILTLEAERVDFERILNKIVLYALCSSFLTIVQLRCYYIQMRHTEDSAVARISLLGIAMQALIDGYDSFLHMSVSASSKYVFNSFAMVSVLKFVLFALVEVRYLLTIWRARHRHIFSDGWDAVRRELTRVYTYFYGFLLGGLFLIFLLPERLDCIVLVLQVYWLPHIIRDIRQGSKSLLHPQFFVGISLTRLLNVLYLWGCPSSVFDGEHFPAIPGAPSMRLCVAFVVLQVLQVGTLSSQCSFGPRWFVPWCCLPHIYNYRRSTMMAEEDPTADCVICMLPLVATSESQQSVVTPCNHRFHAECLERWMDVKMECPTCRAELPPFE